MPRDETRWAPTEGDHADDPTYTRVFPAPDAIPSDEANTQAEANYEANTETEANDEINATDGAVAAAAELGVDLATVTGTGADGRITKADVEDAAE